MAWPTEDEERLQLRLEPVMDTWNVSPQALRFAEPKLARRKKKRVLPLCDGMYHSICENAGKGCLQCTLSPRWIKCFEPGCRHKACCERRDRRSRRDERRREQYEGLRRNFRSPTGSRPSTSASAASRKSRRSSAANLTPFQLEQRRQLQSTMRERERRNSTLAAQALQDAGPPLTGDFVQDTLVRDAERQALGHGLLYDESPQAFRLRTQHSRERANLLAEARRASAAAGDGGGAWSPLAARDTLERARKRRPVSVHGSRRGSRLAAGPPAAAGAPETIEVVRLQLESLLTAGAS